MSFPLHWKLPALARAFVWFLGLSEETLFIWHILIVNGIPESVKGVLGWLLWACLYHFPSVLHLLFEVRLCLFYYLHLWHSSHYSVVIITVTGFIQHGAYLHRCRGRLVVPVIAVSCHGGRSTHPAWLCNDPPAFSPSNNSDCVQRQSKEFRLFVITMPAHGRPSVRCFDVREQSAFAIKGDPVLPAHCTGLPALLESLNQVQYVFL